MTSPLYVETKIAAPLAALWDHTQHPETHQRWDLRFSRITPDPVERGAPRRFRYATRVLPFLTVAGTGVHAGERHRADGGCTSALRFASAHPLSLIAEGSGYWRYEPGPEGHRFLTGYDYRPRWGRLGQALDKVAFRPLMGWATAWSFDRLRIWLEKGIPPERSRNQAVAEAAVRLAIPSIGLVAHPMIAVLLLVAAATLPPLPTTPAARRCRRAPLRPARVPRIAETLQESR